MTETLQLCGRYVSNQGLQNEIDALQKQMKSDQGSEYIYDTLVLAREKLELSIRKEHPDLDPMTQQGEEALHQIMSQDPRYQKIQQEIEALINQFPAESTKWGIPIV